MEFQQTLHGVEQDGCKMVCIVYLMRKNLHMNFFHVKYIVPILHFINFNLCMNFVL